MTLGALFCWIGFAASLAASLAFLAAILGRGDAWRWGKTAYRVQWASLVAATGFLWYILFSHQYQFQYVHSYTSRAMPSKYVFAALWGGQDGSLLWWLFLLSDASISPCSASIAGATTA